MKTLLLVLFTVPFINAKWDRNWDAYKDRFAKSYLPEEEVMRKLIFLENVVDIFSHNEDAEDGEYTHVLGVNHFSDLNYEEFNQLIRRFLKEYGQDKSRKDSKTDKRVVVYKATVPDSKLPKAVDWRDRNVVTAVKDQGRCGACWAFSSAGAMEAAWALKTGQLVPLSAQNLLDCTNRNSDNCDGGNMEDAFEYVINNTGVDKDSCYTYKSRQNRKCLYNINCKGANFSNYAVITEGDEVAMKQAVALEGPLAAALNADAPGFQHYKAGVYKYDYCDTEPTHAVLIVGYGTTESGQDYWLIKNSWSEQWGDKGYFKLARNENMCGISNMISFPIV